MNNPTNRLAALRARADLSQAALSKRSGVSVQYIRLLEQKPDRPVGLDIAAALARALGVAPLQLFPRLPRSERETRWEYFVRVYPELCGALNAVDRLRFHVAISAMSESLFKALTSALDPTPSKWDEVYKIVLAELRMITRDAKLCELLENEPAGANS